jgi:hypothetical protein
MAASHGLLASQGGEHLVLLSNLLEEHSQRELVLLLNAVKLEQDVDVTVEALLKTKQGLLNHVLVVHVHQVLIGLVEEKPELFECLINEPSLSLQNVLRFAS